jgi:penicillin-binding protein 2
VSVIHAPKEPELDPRIVAFPVIMGLLLVVLFLRLWYFQVVIAPELRQKAEASREIKVEKEAPRGLIYDRNGLLVAGVRSEIVITAIPAIVQKQPWVLEKVAAITGADLKKLKAKLADANWRRFVASPIFVGASVDAGSRLAEAGEDLPGIGVETQPMRYYAESNSMSHAMGYVWVPSPRDVERLEKDGYQAAAYVGKGGIERAYETSLMGEPGAEHVEVDARRRPIRVVGRDNAVPGRQLGLTLDAKLQHIATQALAGRGLAGSVVAIEPSTGEVLCLASSPTYDQSVFQGGISQDEWATLTSDETKPMLNRAIQSAYAPGSTFKIVTSIAAAQAGIFDPNRTTFCDGAYHLGTHDFRCLGHHGSLNFRDAFTRSCNVYFATLGHTLGRERILEAAQAVGLGARTGIELTGETRGDLPDERWLKRARKPAVWYGGDAINASIGQGAVNVTTLQMANLVSLVANHGTNYTPHMVREIRGDEPNSTRQSVEPKVAHHIDLPDSFWQTLEDAMLNVINSGTARSAQIPGLSWGGKTGTAEHGKTKTSHAWFVGIAPMVAPKIAICVMIESGGHGGEAAAPVAREVVKAYMDSLEAKSRAVASVVSAPVISPAAR